jgi:signal transduction histidine kinase
MGEGESSREHELREQLATAQAITHIGSYEWAVGSDRVRWSDELYRIYGLEPGSVEITFDGFLSRVRHDQRERIRAEVGRVVQRPGRFAYREIIIRPDGSERILDTVGDAIADETGKVVKLVGTCRDITDVVARDERLQFYGDVFEHTEIGLSAWRLDPSTTPPKLRLVACNRALERLCGLPLQERLNATLAELVPAAAASPVLDAARSVALGGPAQKPPPFRRTGAAGSLILAVTLFPLSAGMVGMAMEDVTERVYTEGVHANERRALEMLAAGAPLTDILMDTLKQIEQIATGTLGSILLLAEDGLTIKQALSASLPDVYNRALEGLPIGPKAGSCGTSMYRREPVIVEDIDRDPLWADYKHLAVVHGLRSCWSYPIIGSDGRVLGSFALYAREPRRPGERGIEAMRRTAHITAIVLERRALDEELRALAGRIEAAREEERTTIARDIHDQLGQALTALRLDVGWLQRRLEDETIRKKLEDMALTTDDLLRTVRRISAELRPGVLDTLGLRAAVDWQAEEFERRTGMKVTVTTDVGDLQLDRDLATNVFRIFQEALTNIARHAAASNVDVTMKLDRGRLRLEITDDGVGMPEIAPRGSTLGLLGMRERARRFGGDCVIRRHEPRGTVVTVTVPLRFPAERASG